MHKLTKPFICAECNQSFTGKDPRGFHSARFPLILSCGHSACMNCIRLSAKQHKSITCEKCKKITNLPDGEASVESLLPDVHVVGTITNFTRTIPRDLKVKFMPAGASTVRQQPQNEFAVRCENCNGDAKWRCDKCSANMCNKCFDKIHSVSKLFKKHTGTRLVAHSYRSTVLAGCLEHEQKEIEYYCEDDGQLACSHCAVTGAHKGHILVTLLQKNQYCIEELCKASEEATKMKRRLNYTEKKLSELLPSAKPNTQVCEQEIRDFFHELHCCLQLREAELLNELSNTVSQCVSPVENMHQQVSENIKELTSLLNDADLVTINSSVPINAMELVGKLRQSLDLPCHLISSGESCEADLHVQLDSNIKEMFRNIGTLRTNLEQRFQLVSDRDLPENHQVDNIDNESTTTTESSSLNGSIMDETLDPVLPYIPKVDLKQPKVAKKAKNVKVLQSELVHVIHIKNPGQFWVQREEEIPKLNRLTINANKWCILNKEVVTPSQLVVGELYLVQYGQEENWYRARLKEIVGDASGNSSSVASSVGEMPAADSIKPPSEPDENCVDISLNVATSEPIQTSPSSPNIVSSEPSAASSIIVPTETNAASGADSSIIVPSETNEASGVDSSNVVKGELTLVCNDETENVKCPQAVGELSDLPSIADISSESLKSWAEAVEEEEESKEASLELSFPNFMVIVQYVDYGNTETVPIRRMRMIQSQFLKLPFLALQCCLWELEPYPCDTWSAAAAEMFGRFAGSSVETSYAVMKVVDERNNILYVDLCRPPIADIANDVPVSVREALVFMEMAHFFSTKSSTLPSDVPTHARYKRKQEFFPAEQLPIGQKVSVVVHHVNSPSDFYIQQLGTLTSYWSSMTFEIKDHYNSKEIQKLAIFVPTIGMPCMANFSLDDQWYRALVIGLKPDCKVEVFYVDFGNTEVLPCSRLAKIVDRFLKLPIQAVHCMLADVAPVERSGWTEEELAWFKEATKKNNISVTIHDAPSNERAVVSLFESTELDMHCINGLLVVEGHAKSTGSRSAYTEEKQTATVLYQAAEIPKPPGVKVKKKYNYTEVICTHVVNPGCIYITHEKTSLDKLMKDLKKNCDKMKPRKLKWNVGDNCAALHSEDKKWYRARITSMDEDVAMVFLMDFGSTDVVPYEHLKILEEEFLKDNLFSIKCHLTGMIPAGDTKNWSGTACDNLKDILISEETIYLKLKGIRENDSEAVDLFLKEVRRGSAVDPSTIIYHSVAEMLVSQGVAIPTQRMQKTFKAIPEEEPEVPVLHAPADTGECNDLENCVSSGSASSTLIADIPLTPPEVGLSWLPPAKLKDKEIVIMATYIGYDGSINFHLYGEEDNQLKSMRDAMESVYNATNYVPTNDLILEGQICIAQFDWDFKWYRAEVVKVASELVEVVFVDYGNTLLVKLNEIRTHLAYIDVPKMCYKAQLYNVKPVSSNGQWPESTLLFINNLVVDKICNVRVEKYNEVENELYISIILPGNKPLVEVLEDKRLIHGNDSPFITMEELSRGEFRKKCSYTTMPIPPVDSIVPVVLSRLIQTNMICMQMSTIEKPTTLFETKINEECDNFLTLIKDLDENAAEYPLVENPKPGMSCCAQYTFDDSWYRCLVNSQPNNGVVNVYYVDYGNSEDLPVERLRQLPKSYLKFPMQGILCLLHGLQPTDGEDEWSEESYQEMLEILFNKNSPKKFQAQIMSTGPPVEVTLLTTEAENEENFQVAYESLIEDEIIATYDV